MGNVSKNIHRTDSQTEGWMEEQTEGKQYNPAFFKRGIKIVFETTIIQYNMS